MFFFPAVTILWYGWGYLLSTCPLSKLCPACKTGSAHADCLTLYPPTRSMLCNVLCNMLCNVLCTTNSSSAAPWRRMSFALAAEKKLNCLSARATFGYSVVFSSQNHSMAGVGRALWGSPSPTPCQSRVTHSRLHRTASRRVWNISREGDCTTSLVNLFLSPVEK